MDQAAPPLGDSALIDLPDRLGLDPHRLRHVGERHGVALAVDLDDERAHDGERHGQTEAEHRAPARVALDFDSAAQGVDGSGDDIETDSPPRAGRDLLGRREAGHEDQTVQVGRIAGPPVEAELVGPGPDGGLIQPPAVVREADHHAA